MTSIVVGNVNGEPIVYETPEVDFGILAALTKILVSTLVSVGLKALCDLVLSKNFELAYPGGKLRLSPKINEIIDDNGSCSFTVKIDNKFLDKK